MNKKEQAREIQSVLDSIQTSIDAGEKPKQIEIEYVIDMSSKNFFSQEQIRRIDEMLPKINKFYKEGQQEQQNEQHKGKKQQAVTNKTTTTNPNKQKEGKKQEEYSEKAMTVRKESIFMKIPGIKNILKFFQEKRQEKYLKDKQTNSSEFTNLYEEYKRNYGLPAYMQNRAKQDETKQDRTKEERNNSNNMQNNTLMNKPNDIRTQYKVKNDIPKTIKPGQQGEISKGQEKQTRKDTIVISDLHGKIDRWEFVKQKIIANPEMKFMILGDAMDRGEYGPEILLEIKELSDLGRVTYLPGNHDIFAYNYLKSVELGDTSSQVYKSALVNLQGNGGKSTLQKLNPRNYMRLLSNQLNSGRIRKTTTLQELTKWLGEQPIQKKIQENGNNYVLSHAMFDEDLYKMDPKFNMEKAFMEERMRGSNTIVSNKFKNCMWYRAEDSNTHYAPLSLPKDSVIVVGHTSQTNVNMKEIGGVPVIYVDCGKAKQLEGFNLTTRRNENLQQISNYGPER